MLRCKNIRDIVKQLEDESSAVLSSSQNCVKVRASMASLRDSGMSELSRLLAQRAYPRLLSLDLSCNSISGKGAETFGEMLAGGCTIEELDLSANDLGDVGCSGLVQGLTKGASLAVIKSLDLHACHCGNEGARAIGDLLRKCTSITNMNLSMNDIGDRGCTMLAEGLTENRSLTSISLHGNDFGEAGQLVLKQAISKQGYIVKIGNATPGLLEEVCVIS